MSELYQDALASLSSTPALLSAWLENLPESTLLRREHPDAWNSLEILKHLIHGEETDWIPRLKLMVEHRNESPPTFEPFDQEGQRQNTETDVTLLLEQFARLRAASLEELKSLAAEHPIDALRAIHPELGPVNGRQLIATWAAHDQTHIYQIARNVTAAFAPNVGPWRKYLRIVNQNKWE